MRGLLAAALAATALMAGAAGVDSVQAQLPNSRALPPEIHGKLSQKVQFLRPERFKQSQRNLLSNKQAADSLRVLVVGVDFSDSLMVGRSNAMPAFAGWPEQSRQPHHIAGLVDEFGQPVRIPFFDVHDAVYFDIQMRKVADYFETVSAGRFQLHWQVYPRIVNVARYANDPMATMGYYGEDDSSSVRLSKLSQAVIDSVDADVDFAPYDTLVLIHAGAGQETDILGDSPEQIFSDYLDVRDFEEAVEAGALRQASLLSDEGSLEHVLILPESESQDSFWEVNFSGFFGTRGVYCFEFGLRLGLLSLSDFTPSGFPDSQGIGNFGLMGYGLFTGLGIVPAAPCAFNRWLAGWVDRVDVVEDARISIPAMGSAGNDSTLIRVPIDDREYFLLEYRLQDPDGDLFFSFDDLNGNNVPDFYDADSAFGNGMPTSPYDSSTDIWEDTLGAEWDWFMSENPLRTPDRCMRAGGSGIYIWHIDERVITHAIETDQNIINADPAHKGVDVEEADGVQDLDSPRPSGYFLGWDGDSWRGEGNEEFGPDTHPSTESADGRRTGIRIFDIDEVATQRFLSDGICDSVVHRQALSLSVAFEADQAAPARRSRRVRLDEEPGFGDLRLVDLGTNPVNPTPDGTLEIVQAGDGGRVYAFDSDLSEWTDGDADAATNGVLARATGPSASVPIFFAPPALSDVDADGSPEILLSAPEGLYAFRAGGGELADGDSDPSSFGLVFRDPDAAIRSAPIIDSRGRVLLLSDDGDRVGTVALSDFDGQTFVEQRIRASLPRVRSDGAALVDIQGTPSLAFAWGDSSIGGVGIIGSWPAQLAGIRTGPRSDFAPMSQALRPGSADLLTLEHSGTVQADPIPSGLGPNPVDGEGWSDPRRSPALPGALSPLAGGLARPGGEPLVAYAAGRRLIALDRNLRPRSGFPHRGTFRGEEQFGAASQAAPLLVDLDGDDRVELLWHGPSGGIHAVDLGGRALQGWPVQAAAEPAGSPALGDVDGDGLLELVVTGRFGSIDAVDGPSSSVEVSPVGELQLYELDALATNFAPWAMGRGGLSNRNAQLLGDGTTGIANSGAVLEEGSLFVHPHPVRGDGMRVRVLLRRSARVRATLYNLEGEVVAESREIRVAGGGAYDEPFDVSHLVSGLYLCKVSTPDEQLVLPFTVVR